MKHFTKKETSKLRRYLEDQKHMFILKQTSKDSLEEEDENIYQKVKNLEKSNEDLRSVVLLRSRVLEKRIQEILQIFKKSSGNQNKLIDELREMIGNNFKTIQDDTQNVLFDMEENDKKYMSKFDDMNVIRDNLNVTNQEMNRVSQKLTDLLKKKK